MHRVLAAIVAYIDGRKSQRSFADPKNGLLHIVQFALTSFTTFGPNRVLLPSDASLSHDSSVYRPNAFKFVGGHTRGG